MRREHRSTMVKELMRKFGNCTWICTKVSRASSTFAARTLLYNADDNMPGLSDPSIAFNSLKKIRLLLKKCAKPFTKKKMPSERFRRVYRAQNL